MFGVATVLEEQQRSELAEDNSVSIIVKEDGKKEHEDQGKVQWQDKFLKLEGEG